MVKQIAQEILSIAGIKINGNKAWDIQIHNPKFDSRVLAGGSLALGESYMDGWWDCRKLDEFFYRVLDKNLNKKVERMKHMFFNVLRAKLVNLQSRKRAFEVGEKHYDIGNELYKAMLDKQMNYSCGYWAKAKNLDSAQEDKLDLICKKVGLKKRMRVLDIGCGWGSFAKFAAEKYGVSVVGVSISKEQVKLARERCKNLPVEIRLQDYRKLGENAQKSGTQKKSFAEFDRIISIGMFEHVGHKNYLEYMKVVNRCLKEDGLFLLHTIGRNTTSNATDPWIDKYIFPNYMLPSAKQIAEASEGLFILEDWHSFGADYDKTLMEWHKNFIKNWKNLKSKYDKRFFRMWTYYLLLEAGASRARVNQLWQIVYSKKGVKGGYKSVR